MLALALALATSQAGPPLDFDALGEEVLERHGLLERAAEGDASEGLVIDDLLDAAFDRIDLGVFDVRIPKGALGDPARATDLRDVLAALVEVQIAWLAWMDEGKDAVADLERVRAWLRAWKPERIAKEPLAKGELLDALAADEEVRAAAGRAARHMRPEADATSRLLLLPTRADFLELAAAVGRIRPELQEAFWVDGVQRWTEMDVDGTRATALEYADPKSDDPRAGLSMRARNPRALEQHVAQIGTRALLEARLGAELEPILAAGLANLLVLETWGELDTRTDGDLRTRSTDARDVFVPGAPSQGGALPPVRADSRWRQQLGKGFFVAELRAAQKQAAKKAQNRAEKTTGFELVSEGERERTIVHGPFLGPESRTEPPPDAFEADFVEFLRAYRVAFLHWLRESAAGPTARSRERFAELLAQLAVSEGADLFGAVEAVYERPLGAAPDDNGDEGDEGESLEESFLAWLARQR